MMYSYVYKHTCILYETCVIAQGILGCSEFVTSGITYYQATQLVAHRPEGPGKNHCQSQYNTSTNVMACIYSDMLFVM